VRGRSGVDSGIRHGTRIDWHAASLRGPWQAV